MTTVLRFTRTVTEQEYGKVTVDDALLAEAAEDGVDVTDLDALGAWVAANQPDYIEECDHDRDPDDWEFEYADR